MVGVLGVHGQALQLEGLEGWLLWKAARSFLHGTALQTKVSGGEGAESTPGTRAEVPLQAVVQPCPCNAWRSAGVQRSTCSPWTRPMLEQVDDQKRL